MEMMGETRLSAVSQFAAGFIVLFYAVEASFVMRAAPMMNGAVPIPASWVHRDS